MYNTLYEGTFFNENETLNSYLYIYIWIYFLIMLQLQINTVYTKEVSETPVSSEITFIQKW